MRVMGGGGGGGGGFMTLDESINAANIESKRTTKRTWRANKCEKEHIRLIKDRISEA